MSSGIVCCPGCGVCLPKKEGPESPFNASQECWQQYARLSGYTLTLGDPEFIHQHVVDAYEAQHAGGKTKPIAIVFGLIGLYLACEKGYTGKQVQKAHMRLANRNKNWPSILPPTDKWELTIANILEAPSGIERDEKIRQWVRVVWKGWEKDQSLIRSLAEKYLFG